MTAKKSIWTRIGEWFIDTAERTAQDQKPLYEHYILTARQAARECDQIRYEQEGQRLAEVCVRVQNK